jgi:hypothetical protein
MNQPDVVLFEKIAFFTSSQSTGMSTCNDCKFCGKHFKRLESRVSQNLACYNMSRGVNAAATVAPNIPNISSHVLQGASRSRMNLRSLSTYESH